MTPPLLLAIDLGSTSLKAIIYDLDGRAVASAARPTEASHPEPAHPEWTVWQAEQIWGGAADAVREATGRLDDPRRIAGVAVTGMGMDGLPVDADGRWLAPMISWLDPRTAEQLAWWRQHVGVERTFAIGGNPVWPINSALRIRWMMEHEPDVMARAERWLLIEDFVNYMLCGRQVTDPSMASCTMLFDQRTRDWSDELLAAAEIPRRLMCDVAPSGTVIGEVHAQAADRTGLPEGTPVVLGGQDHLCGALPVGAFRPGVLLDVTGTWEAVILTTDGPRLDDRLRQIGMTVQAHVARDKHGIWGGNPAGGMLEWFRGELAVRSAASSAGSPTSNAQRPTSENDWDTLIAAIEQSPPGAGGVMFLPHMSAAGCPVVDPNSRGALVGLTNRVTAGELGRAVIEGLDFQFRDMMTALEDALDEPVERVLAVGGAVRNRFWMQNKADVIGRPVEVPEVDEASPLGAAVLAGLGLGLYTDEEEACRRIARGSQTYHPDPDAGRFYDERFALYRQLYPALRPVHHRMAAGGD